MTETDSAIARFMTISAAYGALDLGQLPNGFFEDVVEFLAWRPAGEDADEARVNPDPGVSLLGNQHVECNRECPY